MSAGHAARLQESGVAIFLFHGVIPEQTHPIRNYTRKHLTRARFEEVLDELCRSGTPVSMDAVLDWTRGSGALPPRAFAVTFDDGFENNYSVAAPVLECRRVPCAFYVTTGFVDAGRMSWIDRIEHAFEITTRVALDPPFGRPGAAAASPEEKCLWLDRIRSIVKSDRTTAPDEWADRICGKLGVADARPDPWLDKKLSWSQVEELAGNGLFTVGGHGHSHRILSFMNANELTDEIQTSLRLLNSRLKKPVRHYSYPEGREDCYSGDVVRALKQFGVACCPTAIDGINPPGTNPFHLKRIMVV